MAPPKGWKHSSAQKALISEDLRRRWRDPAYRETHSKRLAELSRRESDREMSRQKMVKLNKTSSVRKR